MNETEAGRGDVGRRPADGHGRIDIICHHTGGGWGGERENGVIIQGIGDGTAVEEDGRGDGQGAIIACLNGIAEEQIARTAAGDILRVFRHPGSRG